ncbi:MAG: hypothetical protein K2M15_08030, partial [Oscillospiraceae bacterium]|nr:hypothetical protein [Oscillospiraceae bacterium]
PAAHTHNWAGDPTQFDTTRHTIECVDTTVGVTPAITGCHAITYVAHSYTDGVCACGAKEPGKVTAEGAVTAATTTDEEGNTVNVPLCTATEGGTHNWVADSASASNQAATCQATGVKAMKCTKCGATRLDTVAKLEHSYKVTTTVAPSCDQAGATNYVCTTCESGTGHTKSVAIPATGNHTWKLDKANSTAATCQATGTAHYVCTSCTDGSPETQDVTIAKDASAHTWSAWTAGTGADDGKCVKTCTNTPCTAKQTQAHVKQNYTGTANGDKKPYVAPTCAAAGQTATVVCRDCGKVITASAPIEKTSHTAAAALASDANQHWTVCKDCGERIGDKANHTWDKTDAEKNPVAGSQCTVCGYRKPAPVDPATCAHTTYNKTTHQCAACGTAHSCASTDKEVTEAAVTGNCVTKTKTAKTTCKVCGKVEGGVEGDVNSSVHADPSSVSEGKCNSCKGG